MKYYFLVIEDLCDDNKIIHHSPYFHCVEDLNEYKDEIITEYPTARYLLRAFVSY